MLPLAESIFEEEPRESNGCILVVRECVRELWEVVFKAHHQKVAIIGNLGIGKSRNLAYGLGLLLGGSSPDGETRAPQNKVIIYECHKTQRVFAFVPPGLDRRNGEANQIYHVHSMSLSRFIVSECDDLSLPTKETAHVACSSG